MDVVAAYYRRPQNSSFQCANNLVRPHIVPIREKRRHRSKLRTEKGRWTLDESLIQLPQKLWEYVIVHELLHLIAPNHGKVFKSFLLAYSGLQMRICGTRWHLVPQVAPL